MATIKDVAREADVAISTVSNVLNNVDVVRPDTREKVLEAVKKLHYTPNLNGKFLKKTETKVLGLFITNLEGPFYNDLISAMHTRCSVNNYNLTIFLNNQKNFMDSYYTILGKRVDGAIVLNETILPNHVEMFREMEIPMVFLDREVTGETISSVVIDNYKGMQQITEYFMQEGKRKIGYIHGPSENYDEKMRYLGYIDTLKKYGLEPQPEYELQGYFSEKETYLAVYHYLEEKASLPQAFIAANDQMAIGCMEALLERGFHIPSDIRVAGFDNIEKARYFSPKLTTVDSAIKELGKTSVDRLLQIINGLRNSGVSKIPCHLILRDS